MGSVRSRRYEIHISSFILEGGLTDFDDDVIIILAVLVALMEYHCTKAADIATRIFEKGLEYFSDESEFALRYLGFLISINDDAS